MEFLPQEFAVESLTKQYGSATRPSPLAGSVAPHQFLDDSLDRIFVDITLRSKRNKDDLDPKQKAEPASLELAGPREKIFGTPQTRELPLSHAVALLQVSTMLYKAWLPCSMKDIWFETFLVFPTGTTVLHMMLIQNDSNSHGADSTPALFRTLTSRQVHFLEARADIPILPKLLMHLCCGM